MRGGASYFPLHFTQIGFTYIPGTVTNQTPCSVSIGFTVLQELTALYELSVSRFISSPSMSVFCALCLLFHRCSLSQAPSPACSTEPGPERVLHFVFITKMDCSNSPLSSLPDEAFQPPQMVLLRGTHSVLLGRLKSKLL